MGAPDLELEKRIAELESELEDAHSHSHEDEGHGGGHEDSEGVWLISYADLMTLLMGFFALIAAMSTIEEEKFNAAGEQTALYFGGEVIKPFEGAGNAIKELIKAKGLEDQVHITVTKTGITIAFKGTLFFTSGSFELREGAQLLMSELLKVLDKEVPDKKILIEGHTDNTPINRGVIASNWELSSLRANAVARLFENYKFKKEQILTIGLGETRPLLPNFAKDGTPIKKNQDQNRRVIIKVSDKHPI